MHIAILIVLIIIAFVIAPWLFGLAVAVVIALAAVYGVYIFVVVALAISVLALIGIWYLFKWLAYRKTPLAERGRQYSTPEHRANQLRSIEESLLRQDQLRSIEDSLRRQDLARTSNAEIHVERSS